MVIAAVVVAINRNVVIANHRVAAVAIINVNLET